MEVRNEVLKEVLENLNKLASDVKKIEAALELQQNNVNQPIQEKQSTGSYALEDERPVNIDRYLCLFY